MCSFIPDGSLLIYVIFTSPFVKTAVVVTGIGDIYIQLAISTLVKTLSCFLKSFIMKETRMG